MRYRGIVFMNNIIKKIRKSSTREEQIILDESLKIYISNGINYVGLDRIAEAAGVRIEIIKKYYKSEEDIINAIIERATKVSEDATTAILNAPLPPQLRLELLVQAMLDGISKENGLAEDFVFMLILKAKEGAELRAKKYAEIPEMVLTKIIEEGQECGVMVKGDPTQLSLLFWSNFTGMCATIICYNDRFELPTVEQIIHTLLI